MSDLKPCNACMGGPVVEYFNRHKCIDCGYLYGRPEKEWVAWRPCQDMRGDYYYEIRTKDSRHCWLKPMGGSGAAEMEKCKKAAEEAVECLNGYPALQSQIDQLKTQLSGITQYGSVDAAEKIDRLTKERDEARGVAKHWRDDVCQGTIKFPWEDKTDAK